MSLWRSPCAHTHTAVQTQTPGHPTCTTPNGPSRVGTSVLHKHVKARVSEMPRSAQDLGTGPEGMREAQSQTGRGASEENLPVSGTPRKWRRGKDTGVLGV